MKLLLTSAILTFSALCVQAQELLELSSGIKIANSISSNPAPGIIRWTGSDFQGFNGNQWTSLTSSNGNNINVINYFLGLPNGIQTLLDAGDTVPNLIAAGAQPSDFLGLRYLGGFIFQVNTDGTGMMSTNAPFNLQYEWGCKGLPFNGAFATAIGFGQRNTDDILIACPSTHHALNAAAVADRWEAHDLTDWYLPTLGEMELMYSILGGDENIGEFVLGFYWTSTQLNSDVAYALLHSFSEGQIIDINKDIEGFVWPVRNF